MSYFCPATGFPPSWELQSGEASSTVLTAVASTEADVEDSLENVQQAFQQLGPKQLSFQAGILAPPTCLESP